MCSSFVSWSLQLNSVHAKTSCINKPTAGALRLFCFVRWRNAQLSCHDRSSPFFVMFSPSYTPMEEERKLMNNKGITMVQWKILNRNSSFVNPPRLPFCCEISGALLLAQPGLTAGRQAGRLAGRQTIISLLKFFSSFCNSTSNVYFKRLKMFLGLTALYQ